MQITITIPDELAATHQRYLEEHGAEWLDTHWAGILAVAKARYEQDDAAAMVRRFAAMPDADKAAMQKKLDAAQAEIDRKEAEAKAAAAEEQATKPDKE
jgi:hypothetical protein